MFGKEKKEYGVYNCFFLFAVLPASVAGYYFIKLVGNRNEKWGDRIGNLFLVLVSLCFYGWARLEGIALLSIYVLGVWLAGKGICRLGKEEKHKWKVYGMTLSILAVTGILIWYKYYNFIAENLNHFFGISLAMSRWIVPWESLLSPLRQYLILWMSFVEMQKREAFWMYFYIFLFSRK